MNTFAIRYLLIVGEPIEPEVTSSCLMDQCSGHDIPLAVDGDLAHQQAHVLRLGLETRAGKVLTCWRLGTTLTA